MIKDIEFILKKIGPRVPALKQPMIFNMMFDSKNLIDFKNKLCEFSAANIKFDTVLYNKKEEEKKNALGKQEGDKQTQITFKLPTKINHCFGNALIKGKQYNCSYVTFSDFQRYIPFKGP